MTRRRGLTALLGLLLGVTTLTLPTPAQAADDISWRAGFCYKDEGMAVVVDFRGISRSQWPAAANNNGYDVRCLTGPGLSRLNLSAGGIQYFPVPGMAAVPTGMQGSLYTYFNIGGGFVGVGGTIDGGWNDTWPARDNVNRFVGLTQSSASPSVPLVVPQFLRRGGGGPDVNPGPGDPANGGVPDPDSVTGSTGSAGPNGRGNGSGGAEGTGGGNDQIPRAPGSQGGKPGEPKGAPSTDAPSGDESDRVFAEEAPGGQVTAADSVTGGPAWLWFLVIGLVVVANVVGAWFWTRARKIRRLAAAP